MKVPEICPFNAHGNTKPLKFSRHNNLPQARANAI
jgi:hypothetical protein